VLRRMLPDLPALSAPMNLSFDHADASGRPASWSDSKGIVGGVDETFAFEASSPSVATIRATARTPSSAFCSMMQRIPAASLVGKRVVVRAELKPRVIGEAGGMASVWVRVDDAHNQSLHFDNMADRALRDASPHFVPLRQVFEVPQGAAWLNYGVLVSGLSEVDVRRFAVEVEVSSGVQAPLVEWASSAESYGMELT